MTPRVSGFSVAAQLVLLTGVPTTVTPDWTVPAAFLTVSSTGDNCTVWEIEPPGVSGVAVPRPVGLPAVAGSACRQLLLHML